MQLLRKVQFLKSAALLSGAHTVISAFVIAQIQKSFLTALSSHLKINLYLFAALFSGFKSYRIFQKCVEKK